MLEPMYRAFKISPKWWKVFKLNGQSELIPDEKFHYWKIEVERFVKVKIYK